MRLIVIAFVYFAATFYNDAVAVGPSNYCQRLTTINYHYSSPYHLPDMDADKGDAGTTFHFKARAVSDGHLRLASSADAKQSPVTVEVIIGAGGNTFTAVRRKPKKPATYDFTVTTPYILSKGEFRSFTLKLNERNLTMFANNSDIPLLIYVDDSLPDMKYISFGSWNNVAVEWSFDCRGAEIPEPPITNPYLRLKKNVTSANVFLPPVQGNSTLMVNIEMEIVHVHLDAKTSQITLRTNFEQKWVDQQLKWNPEEYGNIMQLKSKSRLRWVPSLQVLDVPWMERWSYHNYKHSQVWLNHDGSARYRFYGDIQSWCEIALTDWPADIHVCEIHIGLSPGQENVGLELTNTSLKLDVTSSEWEITSITSSTVTTVGDTPPQSFTLKMRLKRNYGSYLTLLVIPLCMAFSTLIASFVLAPHHNKTRLTLVSATLIISHLLLYLEDALLPALPQSSPRIMKTTGCLLVVAMIQLVFHCFNVHIAKLEIVPPQFVKSLVNMTWMKRLHLATHESFLLDKEQDVAPEPIETSADDSDLVTSGGPDQYHDTKPNKYYWAHFSRYMDALSFTIIFTLLPFLLVTI